MNIAVVSSKFTRLLLALRAVFYTTAIGIMLSGLSTSAVASVVEIEYFLHISFAEPAGGNVRRAITSRGWEYSLNVEIHSLPGTVPATADLYFGALTPGGMRQSWVIERGSPQLVKGFLPLLTNIELIGGKDTSIAQIRGRDIKFSFNGTEQKGMYSVFAILAKSGTDPTNPDNWVGVSMTPLFVQ